MALNEIKAIGQVDLDLESAGEQTMLNSTKERTELDESIAVPDSELALAVTAAREALDAGHGITEAQILEALDQAVGEDPEGVEKQWLAEQLGIADMLNVAELLETEDLVSDFKNLLTEAGLLSANFSDAEFEALSTALNSGELTPDLEAQREAIAEAMELTGTFALTLNLQENARTNSLYIRLSTVGKIALLKDVQTNGGSTVEEKQAYIQQKLNGLESDAIATAPPNQTAERYLGLINNAEEPLKSLLLNDGDFEGLKGRLEGELEKALESLKTGTELSTEARNLANLLGGTNTVKLFENL